MDLEKEKYKDTRLCFILGIGGSGTTLLSKLLQQHPEIWTCPENYFYHFFNYSAEKKKISKDEFIEMILEFNEYFGKIQPYIGWEYDSNELKIKLNELDNFEWNQICKYIYSSFEPDRPINSETVRFFIDKNPSNTNLANHLININNQHFILVARDPRANLLSRKQSQYQTNDTIYNCTRWKYYSEKLIRFKKNNPSICQFVNYESLVKNPEQTVKQIIEFLKLDVSKLDASTSSGNTFQNHTDYHQFASQSERVIKKYGDLDQPVFTNRVDAWKAELNQIDLELCEWICGKTGTKLGYSSTLKKISFRTKLFYYLRFNKALHAYWLCKKEELLYFSPIKLKMKRARKDFKNRIKKLYAIT